MAADAYEGEERPVRRAKRAPPRPPVPKRAKAAPVSRRASRRRAEYRSVEVGPVVSRIFRIYARNAAPFLLFAAALGLPFVLYRLAQAHALWSESATGVLFGSGVELVVLLMEVLVAGLVLQCVVSHGVYAQLSGRAGSLRSALRGLRRFLPVLGIAVLIAVLAYGAMVVLVLLFGAFLGPVGVVLAVFPGGALALALFCVYYVAIQAAIVERAGVAKGMARSAWLTRGSRWAVLAIVLIVYTVPQLLNGYVAQMGLPNVAGYAEHRNWILIQGVVGVLFWVLQAIAPAVLYYDLRRAKEGVGLDEILDVFA